MSELTLIVENLSETIILYPAEIPVLEMEVSNIAAPGPEGEVRGTPISNLEPVLSINDEDIFVLVQNGVTKRVSALIMKNYFNS